jgi:hypothetical protein
MTAVNVPHVRYFDEHPALAVDAFGRVIPVGTSAFAIRDSAPTNRKAKRQRCKAARRARFAAIRLATAIGKPDHQETR